MLLAGKVFNHERALSFKENGNNLSLTLGVGKISDPTRSDPKNFGFGSDRVRNKTRSDEIISTQSENPIGLRQKKLGKYKLQNYKSHNTIIQIHSTHMTDDTLTITESVKNTDHTLQTHSVTDSRLTELHFYSNSQIHNSVIHSKLFSIHRNKAI